MLPFTRDQFIAVFAQYNLAVWPVQVLAYLLGIAMVAAVLWKSQAGGRLVGLGLAAMWLWTGIVYHWGFFAAINKAALAFGALFVMQGAMFLRVALLRGTIGFGGAARPRAWLGWGLVVYAALLYPLLGVWLGHGYPELPMFGITPCPVTIFTFGLMLLASTPVSPWLLAIPVLWSLIGGSAAFLLGIAQDWPLFFSGLAVAPMLLRQWQRSRRAAAGVD